MKVLSLLALTLSVAISTLAGTSTTIKVSAHKRNSSSPSLMGDPKLAPFYHGVASGDPLFDRVIIWTRVTPENTNLTEIPVEWVVSTDRFLQNIVTKGMTTASEANDYTVKVDAAGLQPNTTYYYAFKAFGKYSLVGRTKTTPTGASDRLRFAVVSCANYPAGYFNSFRDIAQRKDLDAVIHLGDYLYEYGEGEYGTGRAPEPTHEILTLSDYRIRHSHYKLDADLRAAHQQHPWITVWDDHETANNSWKNGAENHTEGAEGKWEDRKDEALKAYYEWMPIRLPDANNLNRIFRTIHYGQLLDLFMLDTRLYARDKQVDIQDNIGEKMNDTSRVILGREQYNWLKNELATSTAQWKVLGQQVMMGQLNALGLPVLDVPAIEEMLGKFVRNGGVVINTDQWDGYPTERRRLFDFVKSSNISNLVVLTGDIHCSWGMDLCEDPYNVLKYNPLTGTGAVGVEFVCPSITSDNFESLDSTGNSNPVLSATLRTLNPHIKYVDLFHHGYVLLDISPEKVQGDWYFVEDRTKPDSPSAFSTGWMSKSGANHLTQNNTATPAKTNAAELAPLNPPDAVTTGIQEVEAFAVGIYPNPLSNSGILQYAVALQTELVIEMLDNTGKVLQEFSNQKHQPGLYTAHFRTEQLANGNYFIRLRTKSRTQALRFTIQK